MLPLKVKLKNWQIHKFHRSSFGFRAKLITLFTFKSLHKHPIPKISSYLKKIMEIFALVIGRNNLF